MINTAESNAVIFVIEMLKKIAFACALVSGEWKEEEAVIIC